MGLPSIQFTKSWKGLSYNVTAVQCSPLVILIFILLQTQGQHNIIYVILNLLDTTGLSVNSNTKRKHLKVVQVIIFNDIFHQNEVSYMCLYTLDVTISFIQTYTCNVDVNYPVTTCKNKVERKTTIMCVLEPANMIPTGKIKFCLVSLLLASITGKNV